MTFPFLVLDMRNKQGHLVSPVAPELDLTPVGLVPFRALPTGHWGRPSSPHPWARGWVWPLSADGGGGCQHHHQVPSAPRDPTTPGNSAFIHPCPSKLVWHVFLLQLPQGSTGFPLPLI